MSPAHEWQEDPGLASKRDFHAIPLKERKDLPDKTLGDWGAPWAPLRDLLLVSHQEVA